MWEQITNVRSYHREQKNTRRIFFQESLEMMKKLPEELNLEKQRKGSETRRQGINIPVRV